uniref:Uncharacterized protein n=1 Tax=Molossus molossus TaxID=27622 RepID=A0A7J8GRL2_MOLMO|nr:hypothetical protein HJG59_011330 [Molossus molossus]
MKEALGSLKIITREGLAVRPKYGTERVECPPRDHVCVELGQLCLIWNKAIGASYEEGSTYSRTAFTPWLLHLPLTRSDTSPLGACSTHMYNSQHNARPLSGFHVTGEQSGPSSPLAARVP